MIEFEVKNLQRRNGSYSAEIAFGGVIEQYEIRTAFCVIDSVEINGKNRVSIYTKDDVRVPREDEADIKVKGLTPKAKTLAGGLEKAMKEYALSVD